MSWPPGPARPPAPHEEIHVWRAAAGEAESALHDVLARYVGEEAPRLRLRAGEHGKPALEGIADAPWFNLSHSGDVALVAVTYVAEVGIDVERTDRERDVLRLAPRALEPASAAAVAAAPPEERAAAFYAAWVRREAVAKCHGVGLAAPLPDAPVAVQALDAGAGYAAAVALAGEAMPRIRCWATGSR